MDYRPDLKTHLDALLYFFGKMDIDMISTLLDDKLTYQDYSKSQFVTKLDDLMFTLYQKGDFQLYIERGECYGCNCGRSGFTFIGNRTRSFIDLVFEVDAESNVTDIYECEEFFNKRSKHKKKNRVFLEPEALFAFYDEEDGSWDEDQSFDDDDIPF